MRTLQKLLGTSALVLALQGCSGEETKTEMSEVLHEDGVIAETVYTPSRHGSASGMGPTIDMDGNVGVAFTHTTINIPEKYAVVFKCQHGKFIIQGPDLRHKELWQRFMPGQEVDITYKEIFRSD